MFRKTLITAGAAVALAFGSGIAAQAAVTANSPVSQGTLYSQFLAGHVGTGTDRLTQLRQYWGPLPNLNGYTSGGGPADTIVIGGLLVQNTNGGLAAGDGMVWDDPAGCGAGAFTLEGVNALQNVPAHLNVIAASALVPLLMFGNPQCFSPGQTEFGAIIVSRSHHEVYFTNGASESTASISNPPVHNVYAGLFTYGVGVTVTSGANAALIPTGTLASFTNQGLSETQSHGPDKRISLTVLPQYNVDATVNGHVPSVGNPLTITSLGFGGSASTSEVVP